MNKNPKISIIIPVYNVEAYLHRCLDSILNQSFQDYEVLLIDDGSIDKSGVICDEYAAKDSRFIVFHKENGGVSSARNVGLDNAKGEWVSFVDADDEISEGYLVVNKEYEDADVIEKPYIINYGNKKQIIQVPKNKILINKNEIFIFFVQKRNNALWNKLIKRELIGDASFLTNVKIGEDFLFALCLLPYIREWAFVNKGNYIHSVRDGSAMRSIISDERIKILWNNIDHIRNIANVNDNKPLFTSIIYGSYVTLLMHYYEKLDKKERTKLYRLFYDMTLTDLQYLSTLQKIKLFVIKAIIFLKSKYGKL